MSYPKTCFVIFGLTTMSDEYDAIFFSNILHDWSFETLVRSCSKSHTMLYPLAEDDSCFTKPCWIQTRSLQHSSLFTWLMAVFTRGQQFYFDELKMMMEEVGFINVKETRAHGYCSIVSAEKPGRK